MAEQTTVLGDIITPEDSVGRDAIHIAVSPAIAAQQLVPGQRVRIYSFNDEGIPTVGVAANYGPIVGIVDPFIVGYVGTGEKFYILLLPNTILSLKHHWKHPAFPEKVEKQVDNFMTAEKAESLAWLEELADDCGITYESLMDKIPTGRIFTGDSDSYGIRKGSDIAFHYFVVTGIKVSDDIYFSCSC